MAAGKNLNQIKYVESLEQYIGFIYTLPKKRNTIKLFRGHESVLYENLPTIGRAAESDKDSNPLNFEYEMMQSARLKMPDLLSNIKYPVLELTKLRHYGMPTRLLDFTTNSLIALYFACAEKTIDKKKQDGQVFIFYENKDEIHPCYSPFVNAISEMSFLKSNNNVKEFVKYLESKDYWKFQNYPKDLKNIITRINKPIFFKPESDSERLKRQQGMFLIFPNQISFAEDSIYSLTQLINWKPNKHYNIIISSNYKRHIRNQLRDVGIVESFIFPEYEYICHDIYNEEKNNWLNYLEDNEEARSMEAALAE